VQLQPTLVEAGYQPTVVLFIFSSADYCRPLWHLGCGLVTYQLSYLADHSLIAYLHGGVRQIHDVLSNVPARAVNHVLNEDAVEHG
jgi:hypothetical protein